MTWTKHCAPWLLTVLLTGVVTSAAVEAQVANSRPGRTHAPPPGRPPVRRAPLEEGQVVSPPGTSQEPTATVPATGPSSSAADGLVQVVFEIAQGGEDWGKIVIELDPARTPITANNFLRYVDDEFYDGTIFHRIIPNYVVQGGGYVAVGEAKRTGLRRPIRDEAKRGLKNERGTVGMSRSRNPHSATSQFYINLEDNPKLDYPGEDGWGYCAFARVIEGLDIVQRIQGVKTQDDPAKVDQYPSSPVEPPVIKRAYRVGGKPPPSPDDLIEFEEPPPPPPEPGDPQTTPTPPLETRPAPAPARTPPADRRD